MPSIDLVLGFPLNGAMTVVPSDSVDQTYTLKGVYVGGAGNVSLIPVHGPGTSVVFVAPPVGSTINVMCRRVNATGTTATNLVGII